MPTKDTKKNIFAKSFFLISYLSCLSQAKILKYFIIFKQSITVPLRNDETHEIHENKSIFFFFRIFRVFRGQKNHLELLVASAIVSRSFLAEVVAGSSFTSSTLS